MEPKSILKHGKKIILILMMVFAILYVTANEDKRFAKTIKSQLIANITHNDKDNDGIKDHFDLCKEESKEADSNNDGCPDKRGHLLNATYLLSQINPKCTNKNCINYTKRIKQVKSQLSLMTDPKVWTNSETPKEKHQKYITEMTVKSRDEINKICKQYQTYCSEAKSQIIKINKQLNKAI